MLDRTKYYRTFIYKMCECKQQCALAKVNINNKQYFM